MSHPETVRVFIDSSVLIAAAISPNGHARTLLLRGLRGEEFLALSEFVLAECERNLARKAPQAVSVFNVFRELLAPTIVDPPTELVEATSRHVELKDAPIVAGARAANAHWIASYDRKHLLSQRARIWEQYAIHVGTPDDYLTR